MMHAPNSQIPDQPDSVGAALAVAEEPCEVVEDALPALMIGDLTAADEQAIDSHCSRCRSCSTIRTAWETGLAEPEPPADTHAPSPAQALGLHEGHYGLVESPVGDLLIVVTDDGVADVSYLVHRDREERFAELEERGILATERPARITAVRDQLREYFARERDHFDLPVDLYGVTPFTRQVLEATRHVPFGHLSTYRDIATEIGKPKATRAVGNALGRNPVPVIVPCHRIVRADGSMGWYTGGPHIKELLLDIEGVHLGPSPRNQPGLPGLGGT